MADAITMKLVDKLAEWDKLLREAKEQISAIESELQKRALAEMANKKVKQVKFFGNKSNYAVVTVAETVKLISFEYLKSVLGEKVLKDFVKEKVSYDMSDPFKKIVAPIFSGEYVEISFDSFIKQLCLDEKKSRLAWKKIKGNFEKDVEFFESLGMDRREAEENAYLAKEVIAYEKLLNLLTVAGYKPDTQGYADAVQRLKNSIIVEESIKIGVEYQEDKE